ncbi:FAD-dependent oxidoreductase [Ningiella sp. W23]|uniref:FAD-dependent oxidoreductase n=1 Tax=Ningiella sp. W23 TaxID=3023715 RepID=UPI003756AE1E
MNWIPIVITLFLLLVSCSGAKNVHNVVIIGGGLMGSSAGWELSKSGEEVLLIEQQDEKYTFGSSLGEARISRSLGEQGDIFSFLQQHSVAQTAELIDYLNETENAQNHSMDDIYTTSPMTYIRYTSQQNDVNRLLAQQADPYKFAPDRSTDYALFGIHRHAKPKR